MGRLSELKTFHSNLTTPEGRDEADTALRAKRDAVIRKFPRAQLYLAKLLALFQAVDAIPGAYVEDAELAVLLEHQERWHDGFGAALFFLILAHLRRPDLTEDRRRALQSLQATLVPSLSVLRRSQADEAAHAKLNAEALDGLAPLLSALPVEDGRTALDWAREHIGAGLEIGRLLAQRDLARAAGTADRTALVALRSEILGVLGRFRAAMLDEEELGGVLQPGDTQLVFGPLDAILAR